MRARLRGAWDDAWGIVVATDPGLLRLRLGLRGALAVALTAAVERAVAPAVQVPSLVAMLLGGMIAMNGSFAASSRSPRDAAVTIAGLPVAAAAGVLPACLAAGHRVIELATFVIVMIVAVFVRRFGPRGFAYGMVAWLAYFFTTFVGFHLAQFAAVVAVIAVGAACVVATAAVLVPDRPQQTYERAMRSFRLRLSALAQAGAEVVRGEVPDDRVLPMLHARSFRVVEAALVIDGYLESVASTSDVQPTAVRHALLDADLAVERLASICARLGSAPLPHDVRRRLAGALDALSDGDLDEVGRRTGELADVVAAVNPESPDTARLVRDAVSALERLTLALRGAPARVPAHITRFEPAVNLFLGNLPSSAAVVSDAIAGGTSWWARRSLNTRLCVQVAVAASLTVVVGDLLSPRRYYWAVLACFLALTGTFTTGEIAFKGINRVVGTVAGLVAAVVAVHVTGRNGFAIVAVMVACVFVGLYFFRVSYAVMAFAVTAVMGELYNVLREFSDQLLLLRLAETALGAAIGIGVALVVLPIRTTSAVAAARRSFLSAVAEVVAEVRERVTSGLPSADLFLAARRVDARLHQLALVARPAAGATMLGLGRRRAAQVLSAYTQAAYRARALAGTVADRRPGRSPALAARCDELLHLLGREIPPNLVDGGVARTTDEEVRRLLDDLHAAVGALVAPDAAAGVLTGRAPIGTSSELHV